MHGKSKRITWNLFSLPLNVIIFYGFSKVFYKEYMKRYIYENLKSNRKDNFLKEN